MKWGVSDAPARLMDNSALGYRLMANQLKEIRATVKKPAN